MPFPPFITKYRLLPQQVDCWLWPRKVKNLSRQPELHWQISGDTNELVPLCREQQLLPPGQPPPKMPLSAQTLVWTHISHITTTVVCQQRQEGSSPFYLCSDAITPAYTHTFTTSTTLLPPRAAMHSMFLQWSYASDRRNCTGESKQTPGAGTKPTDLSVYCSEDTPWEAPVPPPPSPGSMWEQSWKSSTCSSSFPALHSLPQRGTRGKHHKKRLKSIKQATAKGWGLAGDFFGGVQPFWEKDDLL